MSMPSVMASVLITGALCSGDIKARVRLYTERERGSQYRDIVNYIVSY